MCCVYVCELACVRMCAYVRARMCILLRVWRENTNEEIVIMRMYVTCIYWCVQNFKETLRTRCLRNIGS
jgi:hypothetical protein